MQVSFSECLKKMYGQELEYCEPYEGKKGNYPAEIFSDSVIPLALLNKIRNLGLSVFLHFSAEDLPSTQVDAVFSNLASGNETRQIIITNKIALENFKRNIENEYLSLNLCLKNSPLSYRFDPFQNTGDITRLELIRKIPALEKLITGTKNSNPNEFIHLKIFGANKENLEEAIKLINTYLKEEKNIYLDEIDELTQMPHYEIKTEQSGFPILEISLGLKLALQK